MQQSLSTSGRALGSANMIRTAPSYRWSCRLPSVLGSKRASEHNGAAAPARSRSSVTARASSSPITNWFLKTAGSLINPSSSVSPPAPKRDYLEARQVSLFQLFDGSNFKFDIPPYQRSYSWRTKQVYELLRDLHTAYTSKKEYFLGAIVTTRQQEGAHTPYQIIDGQQRLTTLVMMLAFLQHWASKEGNTSLAERVHGMVHLSADPLEPGSVARYRLQLRAQDQAFFQDNILASFLPERYQLSPTLQAAQPADELEQLAGSDGEASSGSDGKAPGLEGAAVLDNETWYLLYQNAAFLEAQLEALIGQGLSLQDFMFHCLRNCYVVLMNARDESASFSIFATLNGRGINLSPVDKLKADLLQVLVGQQQRDWADRWAQMESTLGRTTFQRLFEHLQAVELAALPSAPRLPLGEHFQRKALQPQEVLQTLQVLAAYGDILNQLLTNTLHQSAAAQEQQQQQQQGSVPDQLQRACFYLGLMPDDSWAPWVLEFCYQCSDPLQRLRFLQGAEALQVYLELTGDAQLRQTRWAQVAAVLLQQQPFNSEAVLQALALTSEERQYTVARLHAKDLASQADELLLKHLLLRAEELPTEHLLQVEWELLRIDRIIPAQPPEGSAWRRQKLTLLDDLGNAHELKYWYEVSRLSAVAKLGNLLLYRPAGPTSAAAAGLAGAEYDEKAAYYRQCGVEAMFPEFSGAVVSGRYSATRFSFDEWRARHLDVIQRLEQVYGLAEEEAT